MAKERTRFLECILVPLDVISKWLMHFIRNADFFPGRSFFQVQVQDSFLSTLVLEFSVSIRKSMQVLNFRSLLWCFQIHLSNSNYFSNVFFFRSSSKYLIQLAKRSTIKQTNKSPCSRASVPFFRVDSCCQFLVYFLYMWRA